MSMPTRYGPMPPARSTVRSALACPAVAVVVEVAPAVPPAAGVAVPLGVWPGELETVGEEWVVEADVIVGAVAVGVAVGAAGVGVLPHALTRSVAAKARLAVIRAASRA